MNTVKIKAATVTGTAFMTLFSYIVSTLEKSNFVEPELIGKLGERLVPSSNKSATQAAGWKIHYAIGLAFVTSYAWLWEYTKWKPNIRNGLVLGAISGLIGVFAWKLAFKIHPNPPVIKFRKFYVQLFVAHCIFGAAAALAYKLLKTRSAKTQALAEIPSQISRPRIAL